MNQSKLLQEAIGEIEDTRCPCNVIHPLFDILAIAISGMLCGYDELDAILDYAETNEEQLKESFGIKSIPSERTMSRVLNTIDPAQLGLATLRMMRHELETRGNTIAIDGKAIRSTDKMNSFDRGIRLLSAYDTQMSTVIGQVEVGEKSNEIPALQELLKLLQLDGRIITADAMHCQKKTCQLVLDGLGDYVFQVKANQKGLYEAVQEWIDPFIDVHDEALDVYQTYEKGHGRIERRTCYTYLVEGYDYFADWPGLSLVIAMDREVEKDGHVSKERSYYISSLLGTAKHLANLIREHWQIESLHWQLDCIFHEDACRARNANLQIVLSLLRKLALSVHRQYMAYLKSLDDMKEKDRKSMRRIMRRCAMNFDQLLAVLRQVDLVALETETKKK